MSAKKKRKQLHSLVIIWAIFLPFLLFGIFLLGLTGNFIRLHLQALSWQPVNATLLSRETENNSNKIRTSSRQGGKFSYVWQDQIYTSTQMSFSLMSASGNTIDDWDSRVNATMGSVGDPIKVYVNPNNPSEAVAVRDIRWTEIGIYLGVGLLATVAGYLFLFDMNAKHKQPPQPPTFSWGAVGVMAAFGMPMLVLAALLWRDQHGVWAVVACLPMMLVLKGVVHGLGLKKAAKQGKPDADLPK